MIRFGLALENPSCHSLSVFHRRCLSFFGDLGHAELLMPVKTIPELFRRATPCILGPPKDWPHRIDRPRQSWLRTVEGDLRPLNFSMTTARRLTLDRSVWHRYQHAPGRDTGRERDVQFWFIYLHIWSYSCTACIQISCECHWSTDAHIHAFSKYQSHHMMLAAHIKITELQIKLLIRNG